MSRTILVVENDPDERSIFASYLAFVGGHLLEAEDGPQGLELARVHRPDLVLLDLCMPGMDGWETLRRLRAEVATAHIPVVAVTDQRLTSEQMEEGRLCGCLRKPLAPYRVLEEVERCIGPIADGDPSERISSSTGVGPG